MTDAETDLADLIELLGSLRRTMVRAVRRATDLPDLSEAQVSVLRALAIHGPMTPAALAERLHLARSTVSNLLRALSSGGLVERQPAEDRRSVRLVATPQARGMLQRFDQKRAQIMANAVSNLSAIERRQLAGAVPTLRLIRERIDVIAEAEVAARP